MANILRRFLRRHKQHDPGAVVEELWTPAFRNPRKSRFVLEDTPKVTTTITDGKLALRLNQKNIFGWAENPTYRYRDFILEARIDPDTQNGHSSVGVVFRKADERNYYYFLISPRGHYRFDVVFNGNPRTILSWTECPVPDGAFDFRAVVRGGYFGFYLGEEWIGEIEDETIDAGGVTFAAQNYDERESAMYCLDRLVVDSRPYEVEKQYYRWRRYIPVDKSRRLILAKSLAQDGNFTAAILQIGMAGDRNSLSVSDLMMLCECQVRVGMYKEAMRTVDVILENDIDNGDALAEKANLLYLENRIVELRDFLDNNPGILDGNGVLLNLLGNSHYALGDIDNAAEAYERAIEADESVPIYSINLARCHERLDEPDLAFDRYLHAATLLFRDEDYLELSAILPLIERLRGDDPEVLALKAKIAFGEERYDEAENCLAAALEAGSTDSSAYYLYGVLLAQRGERSEADTYLEKATKLEPDYYLYWFRLGENRHLTGRDAEEAVLRAADLAPDDMWVLNLAGLIHLDHGRNNQALDALRLSHKLMLNEDEGEKGHEDIIANLSEALYRSGEVTQAMEMLGKKNDSPLLLNQLGNLLSRSGDYDAAAAVYERAVAFAPDDLDLLLNCAAACIEADRILRAEEILGHVLDTGHHTAAYNLMGNAALIKGEILRADVAFHEALIADPANTEAAANLANLQVQKKEYDEAKQTLEKYLADAQSPRITALREKIREETEEEIRCAGCGRTWVVEKYPEEQSPLMVRGELPDDSPAGQCGECGKVFCIACAKPTLQDGRFSCADCGTALKLNGNHLKLIVSRYIP